MLLNPSLAELASLIEQFSGEDGIHQTAISSLRVIRMSKPTIPIESVQDPTLCIIAQGAKDVLLEKEVYTYVPGKYLVVSVDLPISGQITQASTEEPYLCFVLSLNPQQLCELVVNSEESFADRESITRGIFVSQIGQELLDAALRLMRLLKTPEQIKILSPLIINEILYRLLNDELAGIVRQIALAGSQAERISKVIQKIKNDFASPLRIEELAKTARMSSSSFHHHFKEITAMSPLQYQKKIRLQEARRLLMSRNIDAANAGFQVGYESPSQFSREYSRMFGASPIADMKRLQA